MIEFLQEKEIFFEHIRRAGLKKTSQREVILVTFLQTEGHLSAEDLFLLVREKDPTVGFTTVYRTLKLLNECGLAREERLGDGRRRYEHHFNHQHHDHLICTSCGELIEFYSEIIENKQDEIAELYDFQPTHHSLRIFGLCSPCRLRKQRSR
ncbi:MAG: transcriptional repressor [Acidobacteria bacterium]|nr:transcriptional repressor [Acidobacteriota bacterium]